MSAEFYTILLPPQTLETLDNWGSLDDLPLSLDSSAWDTAGIYGLTVADRAVASGSMEGSRQSVIPLGASLAHSGASFGATRIRSDSLVGAVSAGGGATFQRIRNDALASGYASFEICLPLRIRHGVAADTAQATTSVSWLRLREGKGAAQASGLASVASWLRTRTDSVAAVGVTSGAATGLLIRSLQATVSAQSGQDSAFIRARLGAGQAMAQAVGKLDFVRLLHLAESEPGKSGESFTASRVRPHSAMLGATSDQSIAALRIRENVTSGTAKSAEDVTATRIRAESAKGTATSSASAQWLRFRQGVFTATATLSGSLQATLLGNDRIYGYAYSGGTAGGQRTRTAFATLAATTSGGAEGLSVRGLVLRASASASGQLSAESGVQLKATATASGVLVGFVLGHEWQGKTRPHDGAWGEKIVEPEPWAGKVENAAEWAQNDTKKQGWDVEKSASGAWVNHGDEQSSSGIWSMGAGRGPAEWSASAGGKELCSGKAWVQAHEGHCSDGVSCAEWQSAGRGKPAGWRKPADVGGHGWGAVRP